MGLEQRLRAVEQKTAPTSRNSSSPPSADAPKARQQRRAEARFDLSGICEARDKHSDRLYRLFCLIDRDAPTHGLALPSLVLLGGVVKPTRTEAPQSEYRRIDQYRKDYRATHRVGLGRGGAEWWPDPSDFRSFYATISLPDMRCLDA